MFLGFSLQAVGLRTTTAQRSGFLLYLNVKFVPFFAYLLLGRRITCGTLVSALAAFTGTALLAFFGGGGSTDDGGGDGGGINPGDLWSIAAAAASAMFILRLEMASAEVPRSSELNATSLVVVAAFSGAWWLLGRRGGTGTQEAAAGATRYTHGDPWGIVRAHPLGLIYLSVVSTALANLLQTKAQRDVPAERASVVYSLDPVYGAVFSWWILGETLGGLPARLGASMIFVAAAANSLAAARSKTKTKQNKKRQRQQRVVSRSVSSMSSSDDDDDGGGSELPPLLLPTANEPSSVFTTETAIAPNA